MASVDTALIRHEPEQLVSFIKHSGSWLWEWEEKVNMVMRKSANLYFKVYLKK